MTAGIIAFTSMVCTLIALAIALWADHQTATAGPRDDVTPDLG